MMTRESINQVFLGIEELFGEIFSFCQEQFTGRVHINTPQGYQWTIYFGMGKILWASGGEHPRRRWRRQLAKGCGQDNFEGYCGENHLREGDEYECWDFHLLLALHKRQRLAGEQVKAVMKGVVVEVLFDLQRQGVALCTSEEAYPHEPNHYGKQVFTRGWKTGVRPSQQMVVPPSWGVETKMALEEVQESWSQWRKGGLTNISPDRAPYLLRLEDLSARTSPSVYQNLVKLVTGDQTLRDLAVLMKMETIKIARSLYPYIRQDLISLKAVSDLEPLPSPEEKVSEQQQRHRRAEDHQQKQSSQGVSTVKEKSSRKRPLVAFVDDSEQSRQIMDNIITSGGYNFLEIGDSVEAIPLLLENPPKLIFIDLIMPNINGYELCSQIRKISSLKEVPIVIVTGNDGIVDRMRAKVVGANNFISKPIDSSEVLTLAWQYTQLKSQEAGKG